MSERVLIDGPSRKQRGENGEWVRGKCPVCDEDVVSNAYYVNGKGYILAWECVGSLAEPPTCDFRRVL